MPRYPDFTFYLFITLLNLLSVYNPPGAIDRRYQVREHPKCVISKTLVGQICQPPWRHEVLCSNPPVNCGTADARRLHQYPARCGTAEGMATSTAEHCGHPAYLFWFGVERPAE